MLPINDYFFMTPYETRLPCGHDSFCSKCNYCPAPTGPENAGMQQTCDLRPKRITQDVKKATEDDLSC